VTTLTRRASEGHSLTFHRDSSGRLVLTDTHGDLHAGVEPVRSFPISDPDRLIAILDSDGRELACIADLAELPAESAELIRQELADREFLPRIERIVSVQMNKEPHEWNVITDRGSVQFLMRDDDIRRLGPTRAILVDMHGVRFYIPDSRQLDPKSRRILSQYL
jgi:Domain of unknown function (DUF1854)